MAEVDEVCELEQELRVEEQETQVELPCGDKHELPAEPVCECEQPEYVAYASLPGTHPMRKTDGVSWVQVTWNVADMGADANPSTVSFTRYCPHNAGQLERVRCASCGKKAPEGAELEAMNAALRKITGRLRLESDDELAELLQAMKKGESPDPDYYQMVQTRDFAIERQRLRQYLDECDNARWKEFWRSDLEKCPKHDWGLMVKCIREAESLKNPWWPTCLAKDGDKIVYELAVVEITPSGQMEVVAGWPVPKDVEVSDAQCQLLCGRAYCWRIFHPEQAFMLRRHTYVEEPASA